MGKVIDSSFGAVVAATKFGMFSGVKLQFILGLRSKKYPVKQIVSIEELDAETYRSGGAAALGAVVGGVLTGGIGLIAGAAIGGRRRTVATYLVRFDDGHYAAFEEANKKPSNTSIR